MKKPQAKLARRNFLLAVTAGTAASAAAIIATNPTRSTSKQDGRGESKKGYQLTEHVRNYYRTAKI